MLEALASLVFPIFLIVFLDFTLVVLVIESQVLQLSALLRRVLGTFVKKVKVVRLHLQTSWAYCSS